MYMFHMTLTSDIHRGWGASLDCKEYTCISNSLHDQTNGSFYFELSISISTIQSRGQR